MLSQCLLDASNSAHSKPFKHCTYTSFNLHQGHIISFYFSLSSSSSSFIRIDIGLLWCWFLVLFLLACVQKSPLRGGHVTQAKRKSQWKWKEHMRAVVVVKGGKGCVGWDGERSIWKRWVTWNRVRMVLTPLSPTPPTTCCWCGCYSSSCFGRLHMSCSSHNPCKCVTLTHPYGVTWQNKTQVPPTISPHLPLACEDHSQLIKIIRIIIIIKHQI